MISRSIVAFSCKFQPGSGQIVALKEFDAIRFRHTETDAHGNIRESGTRFLSV
jgi:hypothetical protein